VARGIAAPIYSYEDCGAGRRIPDAVPPGRNRPGADRGNRGVPARIDIVPMPGLHALIETDGFITSDLREIFVDEFVYQSRLGRYRFTLAHELGHSVLHRDVFRKEAFGTSTNGRRF